MHHVITTEPSAQGQLTVESWNSESGFWDHKGWPYRVISIWSAAMGRRPHSESPERGRKTRKGAENRHRSKPPSKSSTVGGDKVKRKRPRSDDDDDDREPVVVKTRMRGKTTPAQLQSLDWNLKSEI